MSWDTDSPTARKEIHEAIAASRDGELEEAVLVNAIVVAEWVDLDGNRWISRIATTEGGDRTPPAWTSEGLLHHALFADWTGEDGDDE